MQIYVKAAHTIMRRYHSRDAIRRHLIKYVDSIDDTLLVRALKVLHVPKQEDLEYADILRSIFKEWRMRERQLLEDCLSLSTRKRIIRPSVTLRVLPTYTIGDLKALLKRDTWIPQENMIFVQCKARALEDDNATLVECGVEDQDTLLTCMGGSFGLQVDFLDRSEEFVIPMSSCFETVGEVKEKIYQKIGYLPKDQELKYRRDSAPFFKVSGGTPLVALGIVKPFSQGMTAGNIELMVTKIRKRWM